MVKRAGGSPLLSLRIDPASHQPVSTRVCVALREMILTGGFQAGDRLPASRTLARLDHKVRQAADNKTREAEAARKEARRP